MLSYKRLIEFVSTTFESVSIVHIKSRKAEHLLVQTYLTRQMMGQSAAHDVAECIRQKIQKQGFVRMIFAAAPSQSDMLASLIESPSIDWSCVTAFHMDEYIGLSEDAPQCFASWLDTHLFGWLPFQKVHPIIPQSNPLQAANAYANLLNEKPIDIVCLGIGVNGHIAFNDPPVADFEDRVDVKIVELDAICRQQQVDDQCFAQLDLVPLQAITLTIPRLLRAEHLFCVVPGAFKRTAVGQTLHGPISTDCPASILRQHPSCTLYLDQESDPDV